MDTLKAHEVITVHTPNGNKRQIMTKYLVVTSSTPMAVSLVNQQGGGEVVHAQELHHIVIVENEHGKSEGHSGLR